MALAFGLVAALFAEIVVVVSGRMLKGRLVTQGQARGFDVTADRARVGWFAGHFRGVRVAFEGVPGLVVQLDEVEADVDARGRPTRVEVRGGSARVEGDVERVIQDLKAWRERRPRSSGDSDKAGVVLAGKGLSLTAPVPGGGTFVASDVDFERDGAELKLGAADVRIDRGAGQGAAGAKIRAQRLALALAGRKLKSAMLDALELEIIARPDAPTTTSAATSAGPDPAPPLLPLVAENPKDKNKKKTPVAPAEPLKVDLPDVAPLRERAFVAARAFSESLADGADVRIAALSVLVTSGKEKLTLGPGRAALVRSPEHVELQFATEASKPSEGQKGTPLSARIDLPTGGGDLKATLSGGPITLSTLGVKEGAFGLIDVSRALLSGKAAVAVDARGAMTFDADLVARGVGLERAWLARAPVHGLDVGVRVAGLFESKKRLRVDDAEAALGALRVRFRGTLESAPGDTAKLNGAFEVPASACQSLLDSVPEALTPTIRGAKLTGTFGATGRLALDTNALDDLDLAYRFDDRCRFAEVPRNIEREKFRRPFMHRIIKPDGTEGEMLSGPDSANWMPIELISPYMQAAVLTTEDGAFFRHQGFNHAAIKQSLIANLKAKRFVRGASTISMQLAKNLFLSRQKTLSRKLEEVVLTEYLEQTFSKEELMELYLNVIEFGPNVYGIAQASEHYYARKPEELNVAETMFLASLLPRPALAHGMYERGAISEGWAKNLRALIEIAFRTGKLSEAERNEGLTQTIAFVKSGQPRPPPRPPVTGGVGPGDAEWKALD